MRLQTTIIAILLGLSFALFSSLAHAERVYHIDSNGGGKIAPFDKYWRHINKKYDRVEIDGKCASACTMIFGRVPLSKICITPTGYLGFHAAHGAHHIQSARLTEEMAEKYPAVIKAWIKEHHALDTMELTWWQSKDIHFIRHCEVTPHERRRKPDWLRAGNR